MNSENPIETPVPPGLVRCPVCGGLLASDAKACPHCGHPAPSRVLSAISSAGSSIAVRGASAARGSLPWLSFIAIFLPIFLFGGGVTAFAARQSPAFFLVVFTLIAPITTWIPAILLTRKFFGDHPAAKIGGFAKWLCAIGTVLTALALGFDNILSISILSIRLIWIAIIIHVTPKEEEKKK